MCYKVEYDKYLRYKINSKMQVGKQTHHVLSLFADKQWWLIAIDLLIYLILSNLLFSRWCMTHPVASVRHSWVSTTRTTTRQKWKIWRSVLIAAATTARSTGSGGNLIALTSDIASAALLMTLGRLWSIFLNFLSTIFLPKRSPSHPLLNKQIHKTTLVPIN